VCRIACASTFGGLTTKITTLQNSSNPNPRAEQNVDVLIMAAGLGTRMKSNVAKVLHRLDGRPLISHVCRSALALNPGKVVVIVGHQAEEVRAKVEEEFASDRERIAFVHQLEQRGTGDAVIAAESELRGDNRTVLVMSGDVPLIKPGTLTKLIEAHHAAKAACALLSVRLENPTGYGRVMRDEAGDFVKIVEQKDATEEERQIREINAGIYCFESAKLVEGLSRLKPNNAQAEFYLTDVPAILKSDGDRIAIFLHSDAREVSGINTRAELAEFENLLRRNAIRRMMIEDGVTFVVRRRPHALGDARPADRRERASAPRLHRPHRRRPQRHHRELPRPEAGAAAQGHKFVTETDTEIVAHLVEREMKDDGLENAVRRALLLHARAVRAGADLGRRSGEDRRRPQRPADRRRPRRRRVLRRVRHPRDPEPHARRRVPRRRGDGGHHATGVEFTDFEGRAGLEADAARAVGSDHGGEGRLQALHAQGDLTSSRPARAKRSSAASRRTPARCSSRR
jgi:NDP-sugar pyrophosphorylase family protein